MLNLFRMIQWRDMFYYIKKKKKKKKIAFYFRKGYQILIEAMD